MALPQTPSMAPPTPTDKELSFPQEPLIDLRHSDEEIKRGLGIPDEETQKAYNDAHRKALERLSSKGSFFKPVDESKLTEKGKADRQRVAEANRTPTQLEAILSRLDQTIKVNYRQQVLSFEIASVVVEKIYGLELSRKNKASWFTDEQREVLDNVIKYFIGDPQCPYALHKGLFVYGGYGPGKTFLFRAMQTLCKIAPIPDMQFDEVSTKTFVTAWKNHKESKDKKNDPVIKYSRNHLLLDDLGEEKQVIISYTNAENPIDELLSERYIAFDRFGQVTHVTSNLGQGDSETALEDQLVHLYGSRILDRFNDMFEVILLPGDSKRG
ncbi:hypothetical protein [Spirosoma foliorum]|uniref:Uncharacterized protein n=1 Tax=Spirosoma foliorum TaxID=2710596 RepID=A0A7G5H2P4_9BACT|nr:hypothetical protein [Spirosoma foliorum]QMW05386.1 hypothetical protein H3H32_11080 [Spirosoma foliorum]